MEKYSDAYCAIELVLIAALIKGHWLRFPDRFECKPDIKARINYAIQQMDKEGVKWSVQNNALEYVNNIDMQPFWEKLMGQQMEAIINEVAA